MGHQEAKGLAMTRGDSRDGRDDRDYWDYRDGRDYRDHRDWNVADVSVVPVVPLRSASFAGAFFAAVHFLAARSALLAVALVAVSPSVAAASCGATTPAIAIDGDAEIVLRADAPYATRLAAEELNFILKGIFGAPLAVVARETPGKTSIVLGGGGARLETLGRDGYIIEAKRREGDLAPCPDAGNRREGSVALGSDMAGRQVGVVRILGNDDDVADVAKAAFLPDEAPWQPCFRRGTLFGVYAFLERFAGVRMYFPGELGIHVPRAERIVATEGRIEESPAFSVRRYGYADGPVPKEMLGGMDEISFKRLNWYRLRMVTSHLACCHGAKTHCLSPETWDAIFTNACAIFSSIPHPPSTIPHSPSSIPRSSPVPPPVFDAMLKDGFTWVRHCRCDWCMKNIPFSKYDTGFATDLVWRRTAELARRLLAKFPEARVSQMSYIPYVRIPTNDIPGNVDVFVARRGPWAEGTAIGEREKGEVRGWHAKLGRKVSLWNYPDKVDCWNLEMKGIPQIAPRAWASYYRAVAPHVTGAFAESESDSWMYNYLNYYVFSRLCWNPEADVEAILEEHHRLMFGPAAKEMAAFFDTLEDCWMKVVAKPYDTPLGPGVCHAPTEEELRTKIYSPEVLARLAALLDGAEAKAARGSLEARRIALFRQEYFVPLTTVVGSTGTTETTGTTATTATAGTTATTGTARTGMSRMSRWSRWSRCARHHLLSHFSRQRTFLRPARRHLLSHFSRQRTFLRPARHHLLSHFSRQRTFFNPQGAAP